MENNHRFDLSDYLIHFFRDVDLDGPSAIAMPEHMGWHSLFEGTRFPAIFMLRAALRNGRLWATWSYRNRVRTIYGNTPAVCFTDMPIAAFVEASQLRHARGEAMGEVALVFPKDQMRDNGALPVIYGLSTETSKWPDGSYGKPRILPTETLPLPEQYRFVADVSRNGQQIDWTHEREWRWPCRRQTLDLEMQGSVSDWADIPGLDFYKNRISGIGVIVRTKFERDLVVRDMLTLIDANIACRSSFSFVLASDELPSVEIIQSRKFLALSLENATINLDTYFETDHQYIDQMNRYFHEEVAAIEHQAGLVEHGSFGGCWLWFYDGMDPFVRALLHSERIVVTREGRYLAQLYEYSDSRSLYQREAMTKRLANNIRLKFQTECCFFSINDSDNPDDVPFYAGVEDRDIPFFNKSWRY